MLLRWPLPIAIVALMAVPAGAADQSVTTTPGNEFSPAAVTIDLNEKVTWSNGGGFHNVKFDDGSFEEPSAPDPTGWRVDRTFDKAGTYRYHCEAHGAPGGSGMAGQVTVREPRTTPPPDPDPVAPGLTVSAPKEQSLARLLERGARPRVRCERGCDAKLRLSIDARTAKRFGFRRARRTIGATSATLAAGRGERVAVRLTRRAVRRLRGARRPFKVRLDVRATKDTRETFREKIKITP